MRALNLDSTVRKLAFAEPAASALTATSAFAGRHLSDGRSRPHWCALHGPDGLGPAVWHRDIRSVLRSEEYSFSVARSLGGT